jgi:uncharacterized membrane protein
MNITEQPTPEEPQRSRARRRRARRQVITAMTADEKASYIDEVASKAAPSFDFFLFSLLAGAILGFALLIDSPYLLLLGALLSPLMTPLVGIGLGTVLGSGRHFGRSLGGFAIGSFLVLLVGAVAGLASRLFEPAAVQAQIHTQLAIPPFIVLGIGAALTAATLVKERFNPSIPSAALAYGLYVPLSAAGFGLGSGIEHLWPDGLVLYVIHLAWATLLAAITLGVMGFRPYTLFGYSIGGVIALIGIILAIGFGGAGIVATSQVTLPTATPSITPSITPTTTQTATPVPPTASFTPSKTPTITLTPTITPTPSATPVEALVRVQEGFTGAVLRDAPDGNIISTLFNDSLVILLGERDAGEASRLWVKVLDLENNVEGWVLQSLLITATPDSGAVPLSSDTPIPPSPSASPSPAAASSTPAQP